MRTTRREWLGMIAAGTVLSAGTGGCRTALREVALPRREGGLKVRFLGTGAADWCGPRTAGEWRHLTSVLLDDCVLIDFRWSATEVLPKGAVPEIVFYTHSHGDHYNPDDAVRLGVKRVYCGDTWAQDATKELSAAAARAGRPAPDVIPIRIGEKVRVGNLVFTALPANHMTGREGEQTLIFLVEKGPVRLLYATDTGGIVGHAARLAGIDAHVEGEGITALIMEATMGSGHDDDFRIFNHSSIGDVARTVRVLKDVGRYRPRTPGQKVYLTHLARSLHGTQEEIAAAAPSPLAPAYDGLEVVL